MEPRGEPPLLGTGWASPALLLPEHCLPACAGRTLPSGVTASTMNQTPSAVAQTLCGFAKGQCYVLWFPPAQNWLGHGHSTRESPGLGGTSALSNRVRALVPLCAVTPSRPLRAASWGHVLCQGRFGHVCPLTTPLAACPAPCTQVLSPPQPTTSPLLPAGCTGTLRS